MNLLVLGVILCGLYFWGQFHKNVPIVWPVVLVTFLISSVLCVVSKGWMGETDIASVIGAWFVIGTALYAVWRRFLCKKKKNSKRL